MGGGGGCWATVGEIQDKITFSECSARAGDGYSRAEALTQGLPPLVTPYSFQISHLKERRKRNLKKQK